VPDAGFLASRVTELFIRGLHDRAMLGPFVT
jgi:hypothetical protein